VVQGQASIPPGPPHHVTITTHSCNIQSYTENTFTYIHKNESEHSEMGPVRQNPIQRPVRSVNMCVHCTVHSCCTQYCTGDVPEAGGELVAAAVLPRDGLGQQRGARPADDRGLRRRRQGDPGPSRGEARLPARLHHHRTDDDGLPGPRQEHVRPHQADCHVEPAVKCLPHCRTH